MKIVLDTNVLVSGLINPSGSPGRIVDLLRNGDLTLSVDDRILIEYIDVLRRDFFLTYFSESDREDVIGYLEKNSNYCISSVVINDLPDKYDIPFLEVALSEGIPLVTGNLKHFPREKTGGCQILPPSEFMKLDLR